jgi:D-serine deaminase-like pyridoxal phosphate-dependent protein
MSSLVGQPLDAVDTPQLLLDLDTLDANLDFLLKACKERGVGLRTHFKSLKCGGLARYLAGRGAPSFLCAKLNEAEVLADAGITDVLVANQVVGPIKLGRLANLARRVPIMACVDDADNVAQMAQAARQAGSTVGVLIEVDIGMARCGLPPGEAVLPLARRVVAEKGLKFRGLQGYDGHLQLMADVAERRARSLQATEQLVGTRRILEKHGIPVEIVTGGGTGTWEFVSSVPGMSEIQPGSFLLMDCIYHGVRPEFNCSLSVLTQVISKRDNWYVLDAGSKAISKDFGTPVVKGFPQEQLTRLSEEHANVTCTGTLPAIGSRREVIPAHCCATMNLHRQCLAVRKGRIEAVWPIEASGRYD